MSKINPRRRPATQADVDRAGEKGRIFGMEFMATCLMWTLMDKHDATDEKLLAITKDMNYLMDSIIKGYVTYADIRRALKEEHGIEVVF